MKNHAVVEEDGPDLRVPQKESGSGTAQILDNVVENVHQTIIDGGSKAQSKTSENKVKNFQCPYDDCTRKFVKNIRLQTHIRVQHTGYKPFDCPEKNCEASFACRSYLQKHLKRHDNGVAPVKKRRHREYQCSECKLKEINNEEIEKSFRTKIQLKLHQAKHHGGQLPYKCDRCGLTFMYRCKLKSHQRRHRGYRCPYHSEPPQQQQEECSFQTDKWTELRKHLATKHKKIECSICGKNYSSPYNLRLHEQTVHFERFTPFPEDRSLADNPTMSFQCTFPDCDKSYTRASSLKNHLRTFHCDPRYSCQTCERKFRHKKSLVAHVCRSDSKPNRTVIEEGTGKIKPPPSSSSSSSITESKLRKILRIKPLIAEDKQLADDVCDEDQSKEIVNLADMEQSNLYSTIQENCRNRIID